MSENRQTGSKLANSVRQAKIKQAEQREPSAAAKAAAAKPDEPPILPLPSSPRVWPD